LESQATDGGRQFPPGLFYRINAVTIDLPPLRERVIDLPMLIDYFLEEHGKAYRVDPKPLSREAMRAMQRYSWPGNIRQLENLIRTYVLMGDEEALSVSWSRFLLPWFTPDRPGQPGLAEGDYKAATRGLERDIISKFCRQTDGAAGKRPNGSTSATDPFVQAAGN